MHPILKLRETNEEVLVKRIENYLISELSLPEENKAESDKSDTFEFTQDVPTLVTTNENVLQNETCIQNIDDNKEDENEEDTDSIEDGATSIAEDSNATHETKANPQFNPAYEKVKYKSRVRSFVMKLLLVFVFIMVVNWIFILLAQ